MNNIDKQRSEEDKLKPGPGNDEPEQDKVKPTKVQPEPDKVQPTKIQPEQDKIQPGNAKHESNKVVQPANVEPELNKVAQPVNVQSEPDKVQHQQYHSLDSQTEVEAIARLTVAVEPAKEFLNEKALSNSTAMGGYLVDGDKSPFGNVNDDVEEFVPLPDGVTIPSLKRRDSIHSACGAVESSPQGRYLRYPEKLGFGQYKDVYRAYDTQEGIEVAWNAVNLNNLPKQERLRIMNEVRLLQSLDHMNLVAFHGSWLNREAQQVVFVTEFLVNGSLKEFISKIHVIRWRVVKRWSRQILRGLEYLHSQHPPIIHRDLKCDNIFINGHTGDIRIGDLGLSTSSARTDKRMSVLGTPEFMAPEMYDEAYNEKVDIYAFGMCFMEMITKERPYAECSNAAQIYKKVVYRKAFPAALRHIQNRRARDFIALCLNHSPDARPSATDLLKHEFLIPNEVEDNEQVTLLKNIFAPLMEEDPSYESSAAPVTESLSIGISNMDGRTQAIDVPSVRSSVRSNLSQEEGGGGTSGVYVSDSPHQPNNGTTEMSGSLVDSNVLNFCKSISSLHISTGSDNVTDSQLPTFGGVRKSLSADIGNCSYLDEGRRGDKSEFVQMLRDMPGNESQMRKVNLLEGRVERTEMPDGEKMPANGITRRCQTTEEVEFSNRSSSSSSSPSPSLDSISRVQGVRNFDAVYVGSPSPVAGVSTRPKIPKVAPLAPMQSAPPSAPVKLNGGSMSCIADSAPSTVAPPVPTAALRERSATGDSSTSLVSAQAMNSNSKSSDEQLGGDTCKIKFASSQGAEADVLRLVMHAHMEGRLQEVEFDFHLDHENDVEVAEEMIKELKLPETELDHIAETIRSLAYHARTASFKRVPSLGLASDVAPSEGVGDKERNIQPSLAPPVPVGTSSLGSVHMGSSHNPETADTPRQPQQHLSSNTERRPNPPLHLSKMGSNLSLTSALGGQNTISGGGVNQSQQPQAGLGGSLHSNEDTLVNSSRCMDTTTLLFDGEDKDVEVDEAFEKEREKYEKKVRTAQKAYEARQHKLVIAQKDSVEENRRMQEKFKKTCEGFEQKKYLMAVEFRQRMNDFSKEWIELKQRAREDREQHSQ
eukprot:71195_1